MSAVGGCKFPEFCSFVRLLNVHETMDVTNIYWPKTATPFDAADDLIIAPGKSIGLRYRALRVL